MLILLLTATSPLKKIHLATANIAIGTSREGQVGYCFIDQESKYKSTINTQLQAFLKKYEYSNPYLYALSRSIIMYMYITILTCILASKETRAYAHINCLNPNF